MGFQNEKINTEFTERIPVDGMHHIHQTLLVISKLLINLSTTNRKKKLKQISLSYRNMFGQF